LSWILSGCKLRDPPLKGLSREMDLAFDDIYG
jgi:hypothetical protein